VRAPDRSALALNRISLRARGWEPRNFEAILSIKLCAQAMGSRGFSPSHGEEPLIDEHTVEA
jgi:hypothetical protein